MRIVNNIINGSPALAAPGTYDPTPPSVEFNNIFSTNGLAYQGVITNLTGVAGNISAPPKFLAPDLADYRLYAGSPGIDAGTMNQTVALDFEGNPRPSDGDQTPPALPDIGAFEYVPGPPRPATVLQAIATLTNVGVAWRPFDDSTNYVVSRAANSGGPYDIVASSIGTNFTDSSALPDQIYYYVVAGQNTFGTGAHSAETAVKAGNHLPVAVDDLVALDEDTTLVFNVLANDTDPDGDQLSFKLLTQPPNGQITFSSTSVTFKPTQNFFGTNMFNYELADGRAGYATGSVTIVVHPVNDRPTAAKASVTLNQDGAATQILAGTDVDSINLEFVLTGLPSHGSITLDTDSGSLVYRPNHAYVGTDSVQYLVNDGQTDSAPAVVTFNVKALADLDRDGMPDGWENLWDLNNPSSDLDGDGFSNLQEYRANTNPRDPGSTLRLSGLATTGDGHWRIKWASVGGTRYRVYSSDGLIGLASWFQPFVRPAAEEIDPAADGTASTQTFIDPRLAPISGMRFYRVAAVQ